MLASDTQAIADYLKNVMVEHYQLTAQNPEQRFADTRDTLCYATNDNQTSVYGLLEQPADLAIVVGGYNSSNTSHLVELCEEKSHTFFINSADKINSNNSISHYNIHSRQEEFTQNFIPEKETVSILITSGASCPDAMVEEVIIKLVEMKSSLSALEKIKLEMAESE